MAFSYKQSDKEKKLTEKLSQYETYTDPQAVIDSQNAWKQYEANNKVADWTGGTYGQSLKDQMDKINNRKQFTYDLNGDALYQQYKDQYMTQGRLASADAIGQASAMTGGYGNSYAATVGNQAYQGYLQKLNDVVPELYNMAYNRYQQEGQDMKDMLAMYESAYGREYGEHRDKVSDYNTTVARLYDIYNNDRTYYRGIFDSDRDFYNTSLNNEKTWNYGLQKDAYDTKIAEEQWQKSYDLQSDLSNYQNQIESLKNEISKTNYYKAIAEIGDGIKPVTVGNRGNTGNGGYHVLGKNYKTLDAAEKALAKYLDGLDLSETQINAIYEKLGM